MNKGSIETMKLWVPTRSKEGYLTGKHIIEVPVIKKDASRPDEQGTLRSFHIPKHWVG